MLRFLCRFHFIGNSPNPSEFGLLRAIQFPPTNRKACADICFLAVFPSLPEGYPFHQSVRNVRKAFKERLMMGLFRSGRVATINTFKRFKNTA